MPVSTPIYTRIAGGRDSLRLMEERENARAAKLDALRANIREGLESGPAGALDMNEIKAAAQDARAARKIAR